MSGGWARDPIRGAGGRRRYNKMRQDKARIRRCEIASWLLANDVSVLERGIQARLAEEFGVSQQTISTDLQVILTTTGGGKRCPLCGAKALDAEGTRAVEEGLERRCSSDA